MKTVLIIGASSKIASETAKIFAEKNYKIILSGRDLQKLDSVKKDILAYYPQSFIENHIIDILNYNSHKEFLNQIISQYGEIDIVLIAYGTLANQKLIENDFEKIKKEFEINLLSIISLTTIFAEYFEKMKKGTIAVISSVAGNRGRQSNFIYGTSKGAVSIYLQGLRNCLYKSNVQVLTIKPGFVDTPMTADINKNFLFAQAKDIAIGIVKAIENKKDIVYLPSFWRLIMFIIKIIPEKIFKRLSL